MENSCSCHCVNWIDMQSQYVYVNKFIYFNGIWTVAKLHSCSYIASMCSISAFVPKARRLYLYIYIVSASAADFWVWQLHCVTWKLTWIRIWLFKFVFTIYVKHRTNKKNRRCFNSKILQNTFSTGLEARCQWMQELGQLESMCNVRDVCAPSVYITFYWRNMKPL